MTRRDPPAAQGRDLGPFSSLSFGRELGPFSSLSFVCRKCKA